MDFPHSYAPNGHYEKRAVFIFNFATRFCIYEPAAPTAGTANNAHFYDAVTQSVTALPAPFPTSAVA